MIKQENLFPAQKEIVAAYQSENSIIARRSFYELHTHPFFDIETELIKLLKLIEAEKILDLGCGNASFLTRIKNQFPTTTTIGLDISLPLLQENLRSKSVEKNFPHFVNGNLVHLPLADKQIDIVTAMHVFYHIQNQLGAIKEIYRVLMPRGKTFITADHPDSKKKLLKFKNHVWKTYGHREPATVYRFNLVKGFNLLKTVFPQVAVETFSSKILLTNPEPYVQYLNSRKTLWVTKPSDVEWNQILSSFSERIQKEIDTNGYFEDTNIYGVLIASK